MRRFVVWWNMLKTAMVVLAALAALAAPAGAKVKIINGWASAGGGFHVCPGYAGFWPYCDAFLGAGRRVVVHGGTVVNVYAVPQANGYVRYIYRTEPPSDFK
jgi:hypothetical protein